MFERNYIKDYLQNIFCHSCGASLGDAKTEILTDAPLVTVAHATCIKCKAKSIVTIKGAENGVTPLISDLNVTEFKKFIGAKSVSYEELLDLHKMLKNKSLCSLLDKKEITLEKKQNT